MNSVIELELSLLIPHAILAGVIIFSFLGIKKMADFTALNTATAALTTAANDVAAYVPTLTDASVQTSIDAATSTITAATATLTAIVPPAPVAGA